MIKWLLSSLLLLVVGVSYAQPLRVTGVVRSATTGETLIGAVIMPDLKSRFAVATDTYGRYSIVLAAGRHSLIYSCGGYLSDTVKIDTTGNLTLNIELADRTVDIETVVVQAYSGRSRLVEATAGIERLSVSQIASMPVIFGEKDVLKTAQLLPGVKSSSDGNSGFAVRGGSLDQNLILLDDATVYNASHLAGFFSTFNSAAIKGVNIYKGNFPAQYGGRVASVVDVTMNDGNNRHYVGNASIGLISSQVSFEGPIQKERSSFLVSARRTYLDLFVGLLPEFAGNQLYFYDINLKGNVAIGDKNMIYVSGYFGNDHTSVNDMMSMGWGNRTATVRWASTISPLLFSNTTFTYSNYNCDIEAIMDQMTGGVRSQIEDVGLKQDFRLNLGSHSLKMGIVSTFHNLTPTRFSIGGFDSKNSASTRSSWENAAYASFLGQFGDRVQIEVGARLSSYTLVGGGVYNVYNQGVYQSSVDLGKGTFGKSFVNIEPRASLSVLVGRNTSIKASYGRSAQYLHMLTNSSASIPTDQWLGSTYTLPPALCDQVSIGAFHFFPSIGVEVSVEGYYKWSTGEADYRPGADIYTTPDIESQLLTGVGRAYGVEFLVRKSVGKFTGWVGYTWSRAERHIEGVNSNRWYPTRQDRPHEVSVVGMYRINDRWEVSAVWTYSTGAPTTVPAGKYLIDEKVVYLFTERNGYRLPDYHRLDLGATYTAKQKKGLQGSWSFGLYNAYGRENPFIVQFKEDKQTGATKAIAISLFRWVPSVSYQLKFNLSKKK